MAEKKIFTFWMEKSVRARLEVLARERAVSLARLTCQAIDQFLLREVKDRDGKVRPH